jgi:hypothetical protein
MKPKLQFETVPKNVPLLDSRTPSGAELSVPPRNPIDGDARNTRLQKQVEYILKIVKF